MLTQIGECRLGIVVASSYSNLETAYVAYFTYFGAYLQVALRFDTAYTDVAAFSGAIRCESCSSS